MYATPLLSQHLIITQVVRGEAVLPWQFAASIGCTVLLGLLLAWAAIRVYHMERLAISG